MIRLFEEGNINSTRLTVDYGKSAIDYWKRTEVTDMGLYLTNVFSDRGDDLLVTSRYVPAQKQ
jgi:hypothetical protein